MQEPIRIAQMMTDMNFGGVEMVVMNYYRHMDRSKVQFDFFALEGSSIPQREEIEKLGGRIYVIPKYTKLFSYEKAIKKIFRENKYHIVHCHMNTLGVFAMWGAKRAGVPVRILHNHSTAAKGETKKNIMKYILRPFAKLFPTELCACSKYAGEWIYGKDTSFRVFNNAIDLGDYKYNPEMRDQLRKSLGIEDKFVIGHVGRFCYQKNHDFLIDIFAEILNERKNAVLLLIGEGELESEVADKVSKLGIESQVKFMGRRSDAYKFYQAMDIFLLPSRYEGLGMVAIEAQASGIPTICSTAVPYEAKVTELIRFVDLESGVKEWSRAIFDHVRVDTSNEVRLAGYDIEEAVKKLEKFYYMLSEED